MAQLKEFHYFQKLPLEIRLEIWKLQPGPPERIVGLLAPRKTWYDVNRGGMTEAPGFKDSPQVFRYVAQPRHKTVYPLLHASRESRALWLPRVVKTPRQMKCLPSAAGASRDCPITVQFDTPFIHYETDTFAVFDTYLVCELFPDFRDMSDLAAGSPMDPFVGLDIKQIRRAAICDVPYATERAVIALDAKRLTNLEELSYISLGPDVLTTVPGREMPVVDLQCVDCELTTLSRQTMYTHPLFTNRRLKNQEGMWDELRPFPAYEQFVRAWLFHTYLPGWRRCAIDSVTNDAQRFKFLNYLLNQWGSEVCELPFDVCSGRELHTSHSIRKVMAWEPPFRTSYKFLCARSCADTVAKMISSNSTIQPQANRRLN